MIYGVALGCYPIAVEEQLRHMKEHGFEATFVGSGHPALDEVMRACKRSSILVESFHAPFAGINALWLDIPEAQVVTDYLHDAIIYAARYEVPTVVVHLSSGEKAPHISELGVERLDALMCCAEREGVTVAFENQRMLGNLSYAMELFPTAAFCWDTGHEGCFTPGREYMPLFGDRIAALHVHDNHMEYNKDEHLIPGDGCIDFDRAIRHLARVKYRGSMMLELGRADRPPYAHLSASAFYARAAAAARRLCEAFEAIS